MELKDIINAREKMKGIVHHTPLENSSTFSAQTGGEVFLKCENLQKTGSFKVRGAFNKISKLKLSPDTKVFSCSAGNHAQGVAYSASSRGVQSVIYMPLSTPIAKISATEGYGANVVLHGDVFDDAQERALSDCKEQGGIFIPPFDDEDVIAGQGTVGLELMEDLPDADVVLVPAGGGGLLAGVAFAIKHVNPKVKVYGVQSEGAPAVAQSFGKTSPVALEKIFTIADGIAVKRPGNITMKYINEYADGILTVSDNEIASTILALMERAKEIVEPAGAVGLSAALCGRYDFRNKKIACVLSGGNIDVSFIHKIIERGLISRGRQIRLSVVLSDKPGSLEEVSRVLAQNSANVIAIQYDRVNAELSLNETILHITCEVSGAEHGKKVLAALKAAGYVLTNAQ